MNRLIGRIAPWVGYGGSVLAAAAAFGDMTRTASPSAVALTWLLGALAFVWTGLGRPRARSAVTAALLASVSVGAGVWFGASFPPAAHVSAGAARHVVEALALALGLLTGLLSLAAIAVGYWLSVIGATRWLRVGTTAPEGSASIGSVLGVAVRWWIVLELLGLLAAAWAAGRSATLGAAVRHPLGWVLLQLTAVIALGAAGWYGFLAKPEGLPRRVADPDAQAAAVGLGTGVVGGVAVLGLSAATASVQPFRGLLSALAPALPHGPWAVSWLLGGALLPLAQEWAFRGFLQTALGSLVRPRAASAVAAVAFALVVTGPALIQAWGIFVVVTAIGYGLGELRRAYGTVTAPAVAHVAANTVLLVTLGLAAARPA